MNARRQAGFTMVELITVMVLLGVLAAVALPRLMGQNTTGAAVFGEQVVSALRLAQKSAVAKRRTVCATTSASAVTLQVSIQPGSNTCTASLEGISDDLYASKDAKVVLADAPPALHFQPDGSITDAQGVRFGPLALKIKAGDDVRRTIELDGGSGHVD